MMNEPVPLSLTQQLAAAQEWWRDAGVDQAFTDEVTHWLALPQPEIKAAQDKAVPEVAADSPPEPVTPSIDRADFSNIVVTLITKVSRRAKHDFVYRTTANRRR